MPDKPKPPISPQRPVPPKSPAVPTTPKPPSQPVPTNSERMVSDADYVHERPFPTTQPPTDRVVPGRMNTAPKPSQTPPKDEKK